MGFARCSATAWVLLLLCNIHVAHGLVRNSCSFSQSRSRSRSTSSSSSSSGGNDGARGVVSVASSSTPVRHVHRIRRHARAGAGDDGGDAPSLASFLASPALSIGAGVGGIMVLLVNRLSLDLVSDVQSRADLIAVIGCSALLLNVLSEQDITARSRDPVPLVGYAMPSPWVRCAYPFAAIEHPVVPHGEA